MNLGSLLIYLDQGFPFYFMTCTVKTYFTCKYLYYEGAQGDRFSCERLNAIASWRETPSSSDAYFASM